MGSFRERFGQHYGIQRFAGRWIQRFPQRSLNQTSFYGLGWVRITTFILVKKLLFVLTILKIDVGNIIRQVFVYRTIRYLQDKVVSSVNSLKSPIFDILNAAGRLGVLNTIVVMINGSTLLYSKRKWSELVWKKAWRLEDAYWDSVFTTSRD